MYFLFCISITFFSVQFVFVTMFVAIYILLSCFIGLLELHFCELNVEVEAILLLIN